MVLLILYYSTYEGTEKCLQKERKPSRPISILSLNSLDYNIYRCTNYIDATNNRAHYKRDKVIMFEIVLEYNVPIQKYKILLYYSPKIKKLLFFLGEK